MADELEKIIKEAYFKHKKTECVETLMSYALNQDLASAIRKKGYVKLDEVEMTACIKRIFNGKMTQPNILDATFEEDLAKAIYKEVIKRK